MENPGQTAERAAKDDTAAKAAKPEAGEKKPRTWGQWGFDFFLYPVLAHGLVTVLSFWVTYHSNFNQNKANAFVKRSSWFKEQLSKIPGLGENQQMVKNLNMVIWSFVDGSIIAPVVAGFEAFRQPISRGLDKLWGTRPKDESVYAQETHRNWLDIVKARGATFAAVIATYFALNTEIFPRSAAKGVLSEIAPGVFGRETVKSVNGLLFEAPSRKLSGWLMKTFPAIGRWTKNLSDKQLRGLAEAEAKNAAIAGAKASGTQLSPKRLNEIGEQAKAAASGATELDARYQTEGGVYTGIFETAYTALTTFGLWLGGKTFACRRENKQESLKAQTASRHVESAGENGQNITETDRAELTKTRGWTKDRVPAERPEKSASFLDALDKGRAKAGLQLV